MSPLREEQLDEIICYAELRDCPFYIAAVTLGYVSGQDSAVASIQYMKIRPALQARYSELNRKIREKT